MAEDPDEAKKRPSEYFTSDDFLRERAAPYRDMSPAQCWTETRELCGMLDRFLELDPRARVRAFTPEPFSDELIAILEAMAKVRA